MLLLVLLIKLEGKGRKDDVLGAESNLIPLIVYTHGAYLLEALDAEAVNFGTILIRRGH